MNKALYWIWLQTAVGYSEKISDLVSYYGTAEDIYKAGENSWRTSGLFSQEKGMLSPKKIIEMKQTGLERAHEILDLCQKHKVTPVVPTDESYPDALKHIPDFPAVLYVRGDISCLKDNIVISVVGTRRPSEYGVNAAKEILHGLAKNKVTVVSGGAVGIDAVAHSETIACGGKTVLVMGCGHDTSYLMQNEELRKSAEQNGAVITEYPPKSPASIYTFPKRNRIISALSNGVVVIEAGKGSGTLNTASHAQKQGKDIFVLPGDISSPSFFGSNELIKNGAIPVFSAQDILCKYIMKNKILNEVRLGRSINPFNGIDKFEYGASEEKPSRKSVKRKEKTHDTLAEKNKTENCQKDETELNQENIKNILENASRNAKIVYNYVLRTETALDNIVRDSSLPVNKVLSSLTELEMLGLIEGLNAGRYKRK